MCVSNEICVYYMEYDFNGVALDVRTPSQTSQIAIKKIIVLLTTTPIYMPVPLKFKLGYPPAMGINIINKGSFLFVGFYCHFRILTAFFSSLLLFGSSFLQAYYPTMFTESLK